MPAHFSMRRNRVSANSLKVCLAMAMAVSVSAAREIHVAPTGDDGQPGTRTEPFRTIGRAAEAAMPGDVVLAHAGVYRERVRPTRGGTSEEKRIVYRAAPGEQVYIKGSERISTWTSEGEGVWKVELEDSFFGDYNPFALNISGEWLTYGEAHHRGDVYLDGEAFRERLSLDEVRKEAGTWFAETGDRTVIRANFGPKDPNRQLTEINVRESVFMPDEVGLQYITVDGFHLAHSAENWQPPGLKTQMGLTGPRGGKHWVIENCVIIHARCVGIILGHAEGLDYADIEVFGDHVVRNNVIRRCGEAGIAGQKGATRSLIEGNRIEATNYRREFGGWETAGIKFHESVDTVIRGNLIRDVHCQKDGAYGIWIDWGNQGTRITGNIICDTEEATIYLEMNHGPILVDNNILIGTGIRNLGSEGNVYAHNLFVDSWFIPATDTKRQSGYYDPHTRKAAGRRPGIPQDDHWYNNIFIRKGLDDVARAKGYVSDHNVFLEGAKPSPFESEHSVVEPWVTEFNREDSAEGMRVSFRINDAPQRVNAPRVGSELIGDFPVVNQTLEDRHGNKITVDTDYYGTKREQYIAGPLAVLDKDIIRIMWPPDQSK